MEPDFKLNRPKISDDEINKHKDFESLVKQFKQQSIQKARSDVNFFKKKKVTYSTVIAGVAVLCTVTYFSLFNKQPDQQAHDKITTTAQSSNKASLIASKSSAAFIRPPSQKISVPYASYKVNAARGGEIKHSTHSKIKVPAKAFINKEGADIVGDVEIRYREFHNQADIIASGIPMTYDSAGTQYHLESAGMFDIRGYQDGEPVFIRPGKPITVELASQQPADHYNQYVLDTVAGNWQYLKRDHIRPTPKATEPAASSSPNNQSSTTSLLAFVHSINRNVETEPENARTLTIKMQIATIPPKIDSVKTVYAKKTAQLPKAAEPVKPVKANPARPQFELDVNYKEFPELAAFKNAVFEVGEENKNYNKSMTQVTWSSATISEGPDKGKNYLLTLALRERVEKLVVYPALSGADYASAIKQYDQKFAAYNNLLAKRQADEKRLQEEMAAKQKVYMEEQKKLEAELLKERIRIRQQMEQQLANQFNSLGSQDRVMRIFQVSSFGICNSDCPRSMPQGASLQPIYASADKGSPVTPTAVFLIEHGRNIVYKLYNGAANSLSYDPAKDYSLCVVAVDGSMHLCSKESFKAIAASGTNKVPVTSLPEGTDNVADFKKALGI